MTAVRAVPKVRGMNTSLHITRAVIGATLALGALAGQAATMTLSGWAHGNGNNVQTSAPVYNGAAGGFAGTLSGSVDLDGNIRTYCVELSQVFHWNVGYSVNVVDATTHFGTASGKAGRLGQLLSYVQDQDLFALAAAGSQDNLSTSLQLAVWNIVYDTDATLAGGSFADASSFAAAASALLAASQNWTNALDLWVLASSTAQDQLVWRTSPGNTGQDVPEPASLALVSLALGGLALSRRRRA
ncbi:MAG: PEP-CTERM sorting domain-containing protein [Rubrivivax sp.]|nr:PEP-CTERM sorting domain-containing protein [Rubrivivax sp.]